MYCSVVPFPWNILHSYIVGEWDKPMMTTFLATFMMQLIPEPSDCPLHIWTAQGFFTYKKDPPQSGIAWH